MVIAAFKPGNTFADTSRVYQWDYGQILRIQGLDLQTAVEIHFALQRVGGEAVTRIGVTKDGVTDVVIPDSMLELAQPKAYDVWAFVYLRGDTSGETVYTIRIPVEIRPKPEAFDTPEAEELFAAAIREVNDAAGRAEAAEANALAHKEDILTMKHDIEVIYGDILQNVLAVKSIVDAKRG